MKAFHFRLQAVLTLREEKEQHAQRQVAAALQGVAVVEAGLASVVRELVGLGREFQGRLATGVPARELAELAGYRVVLSERHARLLLDLAAANERVRQARAQLLVATQDRQALDKYRQKLRRVHDYHEACSEQKMLDDLAARVPALGGRRPTSPSVSAL